MPRKAFPGFRFAGLLAAAPLLYAQTLMPNDLTEHEFRTRCDAALDALRKRLLELSDEHGFEVEGQSDRLDLIFEDADETRFVISPNAPVRQIWISALTTSFKLGWSDSAGTFVLDKTGETLSQVMGRILSQQLGSAITV
jgi:iron donor protein CyaY